MLLQGGHFSHATRTVEHAERFSGHDFAVLFAQHVDRDVALAIAKGDGAFVIAALCEQLASADSPERKTVKGWFDAKTRKTIEEAGGKGVAVLLESLKKL